MPERIKRLRVFAGPNGSGKSTLYDYLVKTHSFTPYFHINPDVIARDLPITLDIRNWPITVSDYDLGAYLDHSAFQEKTPLQLSSLISVSDGIMLLKQTSASGTSYLAAALAEYLRNKMLESGSSFSLETVFSHTSKIDMLHHAKEQGYRTYLYFISTSDPRINFERVQNRVELGGHDVPEVKINDRFLRTMENLYAGFLAADRVFFFDNSDYQDSGAYTFIAEKKNTRLYLSSGANIEECERSLAAATNEMVLAYRELGKPIPVKRHRLFDRITANELCKQAGLGKPF